jgi:hypothetical protein
MAQIEKETGYHFFDQAPAKIINRLRTKVDRVKIPHLPQEH